MAIGGRITSFLDELADDAESKLRLRLDRLAEVTSERAGALADTVGERFSRRIVDQFMQRIAARLLFATLATGALLLAMCLIAMGVSGALGEAFGSPWSGQLAAGGLVLAFTGVATAVVRWRRARREETASKATAAEEAERAAARLAASDDRRQHESSGTPASSASDLVRRHPLAAAAAVGVASLLAGSLLGKANSDDTRGD